MTNLTIYPVSTHNQICGGKCIEVNHWRVPGDSTLESAIVQQLVQRGAGDQVSGLLWRDPGKRSSVGAQELRSTLEHGAAPHLLT
ncbi:hypothetical protein GCM10011490_28840 [Pseudoclavibacter endophyticus]|nr:hypothetical protein GCM10011490_28840 [Pseudoclavibacter endophyticus]